MSRWSTDYEKAHNVRVNYRSIGSGAGLSELKQGLLTFAVSDAPLNDAQLRDLPPLVQVPVTAGPVCVIYNLPGLNNPLKLSGKTLADIYSGGDRWLAGPCDCQGKPWDQVAPHCDHCCPSSGWQRNHQYFYQLSQQCQRKLGGKGRSRSCC